MELKIVVVGDDVFCFLVGGLFSSGEREEKRSCFKEAGVAAEHADSDGAVEAW